MKYVLLAGGHREGPDTYKKGDVVESKHDLIALFGPLKFRKAHDGEGNVQEVTPDDPALAQYGEDVTGQFEAGDNMVFKKGRTYTVLDSDGEVIEAGITKAAVVAALTEDE